MAGDDDNYTEADLRSMTDAQLAQVVGKPVTFTTRETLIRVYLKKHASAAPARPAARASAPASNPAPAPAPSAPARTAAPVSTPAAPASPGRSTRRTVVSLYEEPTPAAHSEPLTKPSYTSSQPSSSAPLSAPTFTPRSAIPVAIPSPAVAAPPPTSPAAAPPAISTAPASGARIASSLSTGRSTPSAFAPPAAPAAAAAALRTAVSASLTRPVAAASRQHRVATQDIPVPPLPSPSNAGLKILKFEPTSPVASDWPSRDYAPSTPVWQAPPAANGDPAPVAAAGPAGSEPAVNLVLVVIVGVLAFLFMTYGFDELDGHYDQLLKYLDNPVYQVTFAVLGFLLVVGLCVNVYHYLFPSKAPALQAYGKAMGALRKGGAIDVPSLRNQILPDNLDELIWQQALNKLRQDPRVAFANGRVSLVPGSP